MRLNSFNENISEIRKSNYYEETEMHLKNDLADYLNGSQIEVCVFNCIKCMMK